MMMLDLFVFSHSINTTTPTPDAALRCAALRSQLHAVG
jgi:hypothetical protein